MVLAHGTEPTNPGQPEGNDVGYVNRDEPTPILLPRTGARRVRNYAVGAGYIFSPKATISFEYGFGDRTHTLFNFTYRF